MANNYHLNVMIDRELELALRAHAESRGVNLSAAARDILRHGLGVVGDGHDAGWIEGFNSGVGEVKKTVSTALSKLIKHDQA